jgi:hypothetical protein
VFTIRHRRASAVICAAVCSLMTATAAGAAPTPEERYLSSYESTPAQAQEDYYASYGAPEPVAGPEDAAPTGDVPWLAISASLAAVLLIVGLSATQVHRVRIRRRRAAHPAL